MRRKTGKSKPRRRGLLAFLRRKGRDEDGTSSIEFVILFPIFMVLFMSSFEAGLLMVRQVMLDRATDLAVRALRLGMWDNPTHDQLKDAICDAAGILPDCKNNMLIELTPVAAGSSAPVTTSATCIDKSALIQPVTTFNGGNKNEMMLVRVCSLAEPMFPLTGLGLDLPRQGPDHYALVSTSAFVNEP